MGGHNKNSIAEIASAAEIKSYGAKTNLVQLCSEVRLGRWPPLDGGKSGTPAVMIPAEHMRILNKHRR